MSLEKHNKITMKIITQKKNKILGHLPRAMTYNTKYTINKISLYADDILVYISHLQSSLLLILYLIQLFGSLAGYSIDWDRSELKPVCIVEQERLQQHPFRTAREKLKYLGKMIFLPQLLYLLQNIPIYIPKTFFQHSDSIMLSLVWERSSL